MSRTNLIALMLLVFLGGTGVSAQESRGSDQGMVRVRYIVADMASSVAFYKDQLGFSVDVQSGPYFAAMTRNGVQLLLSPATGPGGASQPMPNGEKPAPGGGWARMVIDTPDLQGDIDRLRKAGVHFRNDTIVGLGGNQVLIDDPSGNVIELFQPTLVVNKP